MSGIGILAYGSLISDPGVEIKPVIARRIKAETPFPVEYARLSRTRGDSPTVVPHTAGKPVSAEILVLSDTVSLDDAKNMLWRRETRNEGTGLTYSKKGSPNAMLVRDEPGFCGLDHALYTDFNPNGKIIDPEPTTLAKAAIDSVAKTEYGKDGITYLMNLINLGVETPLTAQYRTAIMELTSTSSLINALASLRSGT